MAKKIEVLEIFSARGDAHSNSFNSLFIFVKWCEALFLFVVMLFFCFLMRKHVLVVPTEKRTAGLRFARSKNVLTFICKSGFRTRQSKFMKGFEKVAVDFRSD